MFAFFGAIIGLIFNGFSGAIGGFIIGLVIDSIINRSRARRKMHHYHNEDFTDHLLVLAAHVAKADNNRLLRSEMTYIQQYLVQMLGVAKAQSALLRFRDILNNDMDIQPVCNDFQQHATIYEKLLLLQFLFGFATADGEMRDEETNAILDISTRCGISRGDFESIKSMYVNRHSEYYYQSYHDAYQQRPSNYVPEDVLTNDYRILEIDPTASDDEVKKAYRAAAKKHHPDKVSHLGEEVRKAAEVKFAQVNEAYEHIKKSRNIN